MIFAIIEAGGVSRMFASLKIKKNLSRVKSKKKLIFYYFLIDIIKKLMIEVLKKNFSTTNFFKLRIWEIYFLGCCR